MADLSLPEIDRPSFSPLPRLCYKQSPYTVVEAVVAFNHGAKGEEKAVAAFVDCPYGAPGKEREREKQKRRSGRRKDIRKRAKRGGEETNKRGEEMSTLSLSLPSSH